MKFEFATANKIIFGEGTAREIGKYVGQFGSHALLVCGSNPERYKSVLTSLDHARIPFSFYQIEIEPTIEVVEVGVIQARKLKCDVVIGLGGGSVIDGGKAIAALLSNKGKINEYLEIIGSGNALVNPSIPYIAIPTTAGTGSEVTCNAVIGSPEHGVKVSLRSPFILPRVAVVDPELTYTVPPMITAFTGMDALTQLIEPFVSKKTNPLVDALCRDGIRYIAQSLGKVYHDMYDTESRRLMSLASIFSGMALANAKLGAVHGIAGPFGGLYPAPHGAICAQLLPYVMRVNISALKSYGSDSEYLQRYREIANLLTGKMESTEEDGVKWIMDLVEEIGIPPLRSYCFSQGDFSELIQKSLISSSMRGNPCMLSYRELEEVLQNAY